MKRGDSGGRLAEHWLQSILKALYQQSTMTRAEVLSRTRLNAASVSHALRQLMRAGLVLQSEEVESRVGRPRGLLRLNPDAGYLVAVDLEASPIRFALTNLLGDIRWRWEEEIGGRFPLDIRRIGAGIEKVCGTLPARDRSRVLAVGIVRPGVEDENSLLTAVNVGWRNFPLRKRLRETLKLPFFIETSARAYIATERSLGVAANCDNCIYLEVGRGVGAGIVVNGIFLDGRGQGELGHLTIAPSVDDQCNCGKRGCVEAICSGPNLVRQYLERTAKLNPSATSPTVRSVLDAARRGDRDAVAVVERVSRTLGLAISHLVALFNPGLIVLGGYVMGAEDVVLPILQEELSKQCSPWMRGTKLAVSALGVDIGLKSAAHSAYTGILHDSVLLRRLCQVAPARLRKTAS